MDVTAAGLAAHAGVMSFAEFRASLSNPTADELEFAAELTDMLPSGHETSVAATILRSVRSLPEEGRDFLRLAALLAAAPIPPSLVVATFLIGDNLSEPDAKRRAIRGQYRVEQASLAERGEADARLVHVLVLRTMRFHDDKPERSEALRVAVVTSLTAMLTEIVSGRRVAPVLVEHARALLGDAQPWDGHITDLAQLVDNHDYARGLYVVARQLQERVLDWRRRGLGESHPETLTSMNNLGQLLAAQGDLVRARECHERVLEVSRRVLGEDHPRTLTSMNNLAGLLLDHGDLAGARGLQERVLAARRQALGEDHPATLLSMTNLGVTLAAQGDRARASCTSACSRHGVECWARTIRPHS